MKFWLQSRKEPQAPTGKRYAELERTFLGIADLSEKPLAQFDLDVWNEYRQ